MNEKVQGRCPMGCGDTLFLGSGGYVTCSWVECPDPSAATTVLESRCVYREGVCQVRDHYEMRA